MSIQPRRLLILRWRRDHPALDALARWLFDLPPAGPSCDPSGRPGGRAGVAAGVATQLARRAA
jgi:hypothetical protein